MIRDDEMYNSNIDAFYDAPSINNMDAGPEGRLKSHYARRLSPNLGGERQSDEPVFRHPPHARQATPLLR